MNSFIPQLPGSPDCSRHFERYLIPAATLSVKPGCALRSRAVQPPRYKLNNTVIYFLQPFGPNQLVRPETKHSIWLGRLWTLSVLVCVAAKAWTCVHAVHTEQTSHKSLLPSKRQGQCAHQLGMIMGVREALIVGCWSVKPLERNRVGRGRAREEGWKNGGEAQLAAASNWAEQVSMADQTHMQRGSKERVGHKQSSRAGQAAGVEEGGGVQAGERPVTLQQSQPFLCVTGGRESQLSPPDRNTHTHTHTSMCSDNKKKKKHRHIWNNYFNESIQLTEGGDESVKKKQKKHTAWKTERDLMRGSRGCECITFFPLDIYCMPLETIRSD